MGYVSWHCSSFCLTFFPDAVGISQGIMIQTSLNRATVWIASLWVSMARVLGTRVLAQLLRHIIRLLVRTVYQLPLSAREAKVKHWYILPSWTIINQTHILLLSMTLSHCMDNIIFQITASVTLNSQHQVLIAKGLTQAGIEEARTYIF